MDFGEILKKSWKEYKINFWSIFKLMLLFYAIPLLIFTVFNFSWFAQTGFITQLQDSYKGVDLSSKDFSNIDPNIADSLGEVLKNSFSIEYIIIISFLIALLILTGLFVYTSLAQISLKKEKFTFVDLIKAGKEKFWISFKFTIVFAVLILVLTLLFIIPGIIFLVFWIFAYFILIEKNDGIISSLKSSFNLVKGRWWLTLGYIVLFSLILFGISIVFSIPSAIIQIALLAISASDVFSMSNLIVSGTIKLLFNIAYGFISIPLSILFFKNFYLSAKNKKK